MTDPGVLFMESRPLAIEALNELNCTMLFVQSAVLPARYPLYRMAARKCFAVGVLAR